MAKPWDRRDNESAKAFSAFEIYRAMGPNERSLDAVSQKLAKSTDLLKRWSSRHEWVKRVTAFDDSVAKVAAEKEHAKRVKELDEMRERHRAIGRLAIARVAKKLSEETDDGKPVLAIESTVDVWRLGKLGLVLEQSGHESGTAPGRARLSGDGNESGDDPDVPLIHTLQIEVIGDGGQTISSADLVAKLAAFYDKPEGKT